MIRLMAISLLVLLSCTNKSIQSEIKNADRIEVIDKQTGFSHTDTSSAVMQMFKEVLDGQPEPVDCATQGSILFKKGDKTRVQVGYYKDASACAFLIMDNDGKKTGYRLTHNALVYLGVYFQELKKENDVRHH